MRYSHVVWDFNGTVLDDVGVCIKCADILLGRRSLPPIENREAYRRVFDFPIIDYYRRLGFDFVRESYETLAVEWVNLYLENAGEARLFDGVLDAFDYLRTTGVRQIILSATERGMLIEQIEKLGILSYFDEVLGLDNIHAYSKTELAEQWAERVNPKKALLIGDTVHDYDTAEKIGADCALVSCGHQNEEKLRTVMERVFPDAAAVIQNVKESIG